jgi:putative hemolysin
MSDTVAETVAFIGVTLVIAYVSLVLGELVPKRLALQRAEAISMVAAGPVEALARITRPFIWLLSKSTNAVVRLLGGDPNAGREQMTEEELRGLLASHADISVQERRVIDDVFDAGDRELREVMVPRTEVTFLESSLTTRQAIERMGVDAHSRYPVIQGSVDDVVGYLHVRDVLLRSASDSVTVASLVRPILRCPGTRTVLSVLADMRRASQHMAIVVDEYGGTAGIVTMQDLVEELVGGLQIEPLVGDHGGPRDLELDGLLNIEDFADVTGMELPEGPYETVAGFVVASLGHLPRVGDVVEVDRCRLEVLSLDGRRAARLRVIVAAVDLPE